MNKIQFMKTGGALMNLMRIPGLISVSWSIDSSNPTENNSRDRAFDGDRDTSFNLGGSLGSRDGHCYVTLTATLPASMRIERIYTKGCMSTEEGGNEANHNKYYDVFVNDVNIYSWATGGRGYNGYVIVNDDVTVRDGVTTIKFQMQCNYHRPSNENNGGFAGCDFYELEIWGRI